MIPFIVPVVITSLKIFVKHSVTEGIADGISEASFKIERKMIKVIISTFLNIFVNVVLLVFAVYFLPLVFDKYIVIYAVCSVYLGSIIYGLYSVIENFPIMLKYIFKYKLNLKHYIYNEIYAEAHNKTISQISKMNIFKKGLNRIFGESPSNIAYSIASSTTSIVIKKVTLIVIILTISFTAYVVIFRIIVAPILIDNSTQLNVFQAILYPLLYTMDYFFNTNILSWLI